MKQRLHKTWALPPLNDLFFLNIAIYCFSIFIIFISAFLRFHTAIHNDKIVLNHSYSDRARRNFYLGSLLRISKALLGTALPVKVYCHLVLRVFEQRMKRATEG